MPRRRLTVLAATLGLSALALTACSGGGTSSTSSDAGSEYDLVSGGTLTVATEGTYRPFSYHEGAGELTGFDVEIAKAVADKLGLQVKFQETQWDAIFAGLDAGRFDVIANQVSINPEREQKYTFSAPYTVSRGVIVTTEDDNAISSFADLSGKTTAQSLTSNWYELATSESAFAFKKGQDALAQAVDTALEELRADGTLTQISEKYFGADVTQ